ncbi:DUF1385 domain-containing protein [Candidatus Parcubacteria bacterium]|nr:DUF1385 domain-containing protein [Candidatus Parcubacteria bacterium]
MRGRSFPSGFVLYEQEDVIIEIEDLSFLAKSTTMIIGMTILFSVIQIVISQILLFILIFVCLVKICYYETSEWHAIEYKLIYLLENNCLLTIDNLERAPMKHKRCGAHNIFLHKPSLKKIKIALELGEEYLNKKKLDSSQ